MKHSQPVAEVDTDERTGVLEKRLQRARTKIELLEGMIEEKTRNLYLAQEEVRQKGAFLESILTSMPSAVIVTDLEDRVTAIGGSTSLLTGLTEQQTIGRSVADLVAEHDQADDQSPWRGADLIAADGTLVPVSVAISEISSESATDGRVMVLTDLTEQQEMEMQLRHAQKLESVGQMAAGVAHEINTPIQFIGDSVTFLGEAITDALEVLSAYEELREMAEGQPELKAKALELAEIEEDADVEFIREEAPRSIERTHEGVRRVAKIVAAMKQFSHPGGGAMSPENINDVIETALTVATNEFKYVADVNLELGEIPNVACDRGDIGQVVLNLVVNAAHAIEEHLEPGGRGAIDIVTRPVNDGVEIAVRDSGGGVPEEIRARIFDPFFTTKAPGKGTGQGLSITHSLIVDKHKGSLDLDVEDGVGSTFRIWIPVG